MIIIIGIFNILACSRSFCDVYTDNVYGVIADVGGRITDLIPIAIGEILMYAGIFLLMVSVFLMILLIFLRRRNGYKSFTAKYMKGMLCIFLCIILIYTFNWIIPFRSSLMGRPEYNDIYQTAGGEMADNEVFDNKTAYNGELENAAVDDSESDNAAVNNKDYERKLRCIRTYIVDNLNTLSEQVRRDEDGSIIYMEKDEVENKVAYAMQELADQFPRLEGYYPQLKFAICSELLNYMWIGGYTYPYTMEITGGRYLDKLYYPVLYAHESAHHQGYYQENEANLLEYLGCINSNDKLIQYSGYLAMYYYIDDAHRSVLSKLDDELLWREYDKVQVAEQVWNDSDESIDAADAEFEDSGKPMEQFEAAAEDVADIGWETQGDFLEENSYDGVVELLLRYYDGKLY